MLFSFVRINSNNKLLCSTNIRQLFGSTKAATIESHTVQRHQSVHFYSTDSILDVPSQQYDWKKIVCDAQRIVDYPTSYISLRWLLSDKVANVGYKLRELASSPNSLHRTARFVAMNENRYIFF